MTTCEAVDSHSPRFSVCNLGSIRNGSFVHKPLTLFCGPNNSGKTWALYSLYNFYRLCRDHKEPDLPAFNDAVSASLPDLFNSALPVLEGVRFALESEDAWRRLKEASDSIDMFLMPAERNGLHLFFRELSTRRTALLHHASRENIDIAELLRDVIRSRYAVPIAFYIDWLNDLTEAQKSKSQGFHTHAEQLKRGVVGGAYRVDSRSGAIAFKPYQRRRDGVGTRQLGLHMTSGAVKSLFGLWFYLEHQAKPGAMLMIDEPELNIHPENQRKIARLLARLVNDGLKITISTHSDYIVREINSLIMLSLDEDGALRRKHKYEEAEILKPEQVGAYLFDEHTIEPFKIDPEDGIYATTFDRVIDDLNTVNDDIYYSLKERKESMHD